ncbi:MAG TPA: JDVT-CTERM system CAAX-type protease [Gammaproteobacteria bacterium]|nr:JDVT-CTERM system CAAX-type protease [Gammaproteobacteria bacterium]
MPRIDPGWPLRDPARFLYPALIWPVVEEILFRGLLQGELRRHLGNAGIGPLTHANLVTSLVFSALHFIHHPPGWAAAVFLPSLLFGLARERSGTLLAPIVLHAFYNSGYLWLFGA